MLQQVVMVIRKNNLTGRLKMRIIGFRFQVSGFGLYETDTSYETSILPLDRRIKADQHEYKVKMSSKLKKKFNHIYNFERSIGSSVALRVIKAQPIGVWEFLIPVVFILHFMRNKQSR